MRYQFSLRTIENIIVILFEISFILLAIQAVNIDDIPRLYIAITAFFMTLISYAAEKLLRIQFPFVSMTASVIRSEILLASLSAFILLTGGWIPYRHKRDSPGC
jgi:hypothetical protein